MKPLLLNALDNWPYGTIATTSFFESCGISRQLVNLYKKSGWIVALGQGAYRRADDKKISWEGGVFALQKMLDLKTYPGSITALNLRGLTSGIKSSKMVFLLSPNRFLSYSKTIFRPVPEWIYSFENKTVSITQIQSSLFSKVNDVTKYMYPHNNFEILISSIEQAILEMLEQVNNTVSLKDAFIVYRNINQIDINKMNFLLEHCNSIKAKRLFVFMANCFQKNWLDKIKLNKINMGVSPPVSLSIYGTPSEYKLFTKHMKSIRA